MAINKQTKVMQAYDMASPLRLELDKVGHVMEVTEDKAGILWERWIIERSGISVILFATPHWVDVFAPVTNDPTWKGTIDAVMALTKLSTADTTE